MFDFICYVFFICHSTQFPSMHAELLVRSRSAARGHAAQCAILDKNRWTAQILTDFNDFSLKYS